MSEELKPCPFCSGCGILETETVRSGYGEYENSDLYHVVKCASCRASGRRYHQQHLISFTSYTVGDFRNNPLLRAKVEDEYEAYCKQTKQLAIKAWNARAQDSELADLRTKLQDVKLALHASRHVAQLEHTRAEEAERKLADARREGMEEAAKVCEEQAKELE